MYFRCNPSSMALTICALPRRISIFSNRHCSSIGIASFLVVNTMKIVGVRQSVWHDEGRVSLLESGIDYLGESVVSVMGTEVEGAIWG